MGAASWFNVLVEWTGADIAGIVAAVVSVGGAVLARTDKAKAEEAARKAAQSQEKATKAQEETAKSYEAISSAQASISRSSRMSVANQSGRFHLELINDDELRVWNTLGYTPTGVSIDSSEIENAPIALRHLGPSESRTIKLTDRSWAKSDNPRISSVYLSWIDKSGKPENQRWSFSDES